MKAPGTAGSALAAAFAIALCACGLKATDEAKPVGEPVQDPPTLHSLGFYWIIKGDDNKDARVELAYRQVGSTPWREGRPLLRIEKGAHFHGCKPGNFCQRIESRIKVPDDAWLFAGSLLLLTPDTQYEVRLTLNDPDGGTLEKQLQARTCAEPKPPGSLREYFVAPGHGGGTGTEDDPFAGIAAADEFAKPGTRFTLLPGIYLGAHVLTKSGKPGAPIIWRGRGEVILDGRKSLGRHNVALKANNLQDVWFENLTIRNGINGITAHESRRIVIRRCQLFNCDYGIFAVGNRKGKLGGFFIADNVIEGPCVWPRTEEKGIENPRGIQIAGAGHDICYNFIRGFADAVDCFGGSPVCEAIDVHHNDVSELTDDGIEMDYSIRNTRCFYNRLTNVFQGISVQPIFGGPVYVFRNVMYNVGCEPFKMHNCPSGALFIHNTVVKKGPPSGLYTGQPVSNTFCRNNLYIGTGGRAYHSDAPMRECDFDYDGFGGWNADVFIKWNNVFYRTPEEMRTNGPVYQHVILVDPKKVFAADISAPQDDTPVYDRKRVDLRLKDGTSAIDSGQILPGFTDGHRSTAPDLGAYELGEDLPHYGPRPEQ